MTPVRTAQDALEFRISAACKFDVAIELKEIRNYIFQLDCKVGGS